ncbi:hypothetical protein Cgig2_020085 [Carnegiea gigantea]|uniref:F-box domain-containing protein n=1 Tax=Carnegiea gigantea TaxID=171969 RepID=A0A9Q1KFE1_9CARY|nr:hypothetical protein Cgig2_020085 [Carnegiea gigantea]
MVKSMQPKIQTKPLRQGDETSSCDQISSLLEADKISSLPNDVLLHILSFLSIENAVATSALSTRWKHVWTGIRVLDLSSWKCGRYLRPEHGRINYENLLLVLDVLDVGCLESVRCHFSRVGSTRPSECLASLMKRSIRKLELVYERVEPVVLPLSLFACEKLVELKLFGRFIIRFPGSWHCPNLKVVSLAQVAFAHGSVEDLLRGCPILEELAYESDVGSERVEQIALPVSVVAVDLVDGGSMEYLLGACPVLEELYINECEIRGDANFEVCSSSLKILKRSTPKEPWRKRSKIRIKIDTPNLEHLHLRDVEVEFRAPNLRSLKLHDFVFSDGSYMEDMPLKDLLRSCPDIEELSIIHYKSQRAAAVFDVCSSSLKILQCDRPNLYNDTVIKIDTPYLEHLQLEEVELVELRAPNLRHLKLEDFVISDGFHMEEVPFIVETCLNHWENYTGDPFRAFYSAISGSKALDLGGCLSSLEGVKLSEMMALSNVTDLKVETWSWTMILDLLELAPILKSLTLTHDSDFWKDKKWHGPRRVAQCFRVLEQVTFHNYKLDEYGEKVIRCFLRKAKSLKKMQVTIRGYFYLGKKDHELSEVMPKLTQHDVKLGNHEGVRAAQNVFDEMPLRVQVESPPAYYQRDGDMFGLKLLRVLDFSYWESDRRVHEGLVVLEVSYLGLVRCRFNGVLDSKCVCTCLVSLLKRGFHNLELVCERTWPIMLPSSLLACEELVELKLFGEFTIRDLPSSLHWPNLKVILIEDVDLADGDSLEDLLRGCPVLEKLYINNCKIKILGTTSINVCSSSLKILQYIACQYSLIRLMVRSIDTPNLEHLHLTNVGVLEVGAPNLRCLKLHDFLLSNDSYTKETVLKDLLMGCPVLEEL